MRAPSICAKLCAIRRNATSIFSEILSFVLESTLFLFDGVADCGCRCEVTGARFSFDGSEIVASCLNDRIYVFDTDRNYSEEFNIDYFDPNVGREAEFDGSAGSEEESDYLDMHSHGEQAHASSSHVSSDQEGTGSQWPQTYDHMYKGHCSASTIKYANFFGPRSEYVVSGSDDARVFIWDKKSTELVTVLEVLLIMLLLSQALTGSRATRMWSTALRDIRIALSSLRAE